MNSLLYLDQSSMTAAGLHHFGIEIDRLLITGN